MKTGLSADYEIRPYKAGDEAAILDLFKASFDRDLSVDFWKWRYLDHPSGGSLIALAWHEDKLVAHYGASRSPMLRDGNVLQTALSISTMTHPDHRGRGLLEAVGEALYSNLVEQGCEAAWGFPNSKINATRQRKLGWQPICDVITLSLSAKQARVGNDDLGLAVVETSKIDERFGRLANEIAQNGVLQGSKDVETLRWRVDENPQNAYTRWIIENGNDISAYAITKSYGEDSIDIVDLCSVDEAHTKGILSAITEAAKRKNVTQLNTWALPTARERVALEHFGFAAKAPVTYLGGRSFGGSVDDITDTRRWRISMLDSDLY